MAVGWLGFLEAEPEEGFCAGGSSWEEWRKQARAGEKNLSKEGAPDGN